MLESLWRAFPQKEGRIKPLAVAVVLSRLEGQGNQARSLFDAGRSHDRLNAIIDSINLRYGKNTLYFGGAHTALQSAPMRIAFGHIPDLETEGD